VEDVKTMAKEKAEKTAAAAKNNAAAKKSKKKENIFNVLQGRFGRWQRN